MKLLLVTIHFSLVIVQLGKVIQEIATAQMDQHHSWYTILVEARDST